MSRKPTVISLFAGCGGSSLGYKWAGFNELLAVEWDANAVATFKLNFPRVPVYHGDIKELTTAECMKLTGIKKGELDVLDGSPPCQGFSTNGKRGMSDERNFLSREYVRLLQALQPKSFIIENVPGLTKGHMRGLMIEMLKALRDAGYNCRAEIMNAAHYGVAQHRKRLIIIGARKDIAADITFPLPNATKLKTVEEAFSEIENNERDEPKLSPRFARYWNAVAVGRMGGFNESKKLNLKNPSTTLMTSHGYGGKFHPTECRALTSAERKALSSFPESFRFLNWKSCVELTGNCVPPLLMKAVAEHVKLRILRA